MLSLRGLEKRFGDVVAVDGLDLDIRAGEVFGLLGPNGAGKTTTLSMVAGLTRPDRGEVVVEGAGHAHTKAARSRLGMAPQQIALYEVMSARENLALFGRVYGLGAAGASSRADELLGFVGLSDRADDRVAGFSGGMKRRLNLAAAVVHKPAMVLLDEPTAGVDTHSRNAIFELIASLKAGGTTVVYTTHYMEEAQRLCDRVGVLDHGKLLALGTVDELVEAHGGDSEVTVERAGREPDRTETAEPAKLLADLLRGDDPPGSVQVDRPGLESVFLNLTGRSLRD